jgi:hypothetical protein
MKDVDQRILDMMEFKDQTRCQSCNGGRWMIDPKTGAPYDCKGCAGTGTSPVPLCEATEIDRPLPKNGD